MNRTLVEQYVIGGISLLDTALARYCDGLLDGMTYKQWFLLMMIKRMPPGEKSVNDIAEFTGSTRQNVKKMLSSLAKKGLVLIEKSPTDARALSVSVTSKAERALAASDPGVTAGCDRLFDAYSDEELSVFAACLNRLLDRLEDDEAATSSTAGSPEAPEAEAAGTAASEAPDARGA